MLGEDIIWEHTVTASPFCPAIPFSCPVLFLNKHFGCNENEMCIRLIFKITNS